MTTISVCPHTFGEKIPRVRAGDIVQLDPGKYCDPVVLSGLHGTRGRPIIIESNSTGISNRACFSSDISFGDYKTIANRIAQKRQNSGYFPSVGQTADEAMLVLHNCQYVVIRNLDFHGCWPVLSTSTNANISSLTMSISGKALSPLV